MLASHSPYNYWHASQPFAFEPLDSSVQYMQTQDSDFLEFEWGLIHLHQSLVPTMLGWATIIVFLHSDLSLDKSSDVLRFFRSIFTTSIHVLFGISLFLGGPSTCIEKLFLNGAIVCLLLPCLDHLKQVYANLSHIDAIATPKCY